MHLEKKGYDARVVFLLSLPRSATKLHTANSTNPPKTAVCTHCCLSGLPQGKDRPAGISPPAGGLGEHLGAGMGMSPGTVPRAPWTPTCRSAHRWCRPCRRSGPRCTPPCCRLGHRHTAGSCNGDSRDTTVTSRSAGGSVPQRTGHTRHQRIHPPLHQMDQGGAQRVGRGCSTDDADTSKGA